MTKELFVKAINSIKDHRERENKFITGLDALSPDTENSTFVYSSYESLVVELLSDAMNDTIDVIGFFIYDMNFGTENSLTSLFMDDVPVDLSSAEKLYDYLKERIPDDEDIEK